MADESGGDDTPIVIKKIVKGGGHHGGAWKVAYADFVTAMMAFFLLLWLLNVTDIEEKNAISNYFSPSHPSVSSQESGAGGVMGGLSVATEGAMATNIQNLVQQEATGKGGADKTTSQAAAIDAEQEAVEELKQAEEEKLEAVKEAIEQAIAQTPELADLAENLLIDMTREGLRIQVVDSEGKPMFPSGSARMYQKTRELMTQVAKAIKAVPNEISIRGHTDSIPYGSGATYTNWELSTDRANSSRRVLLEAEIPADRINNVVGKADTEHLLPKDPTNPRNRRISIILLREELTDPQAYKERVQKLADQKRAEMGAVPTKAVPSLPRATPAQERDPNAVPSVPRPQSGSFNKTDGKVQFP